MPTWIVLLITAAYMAVLFAIAWRRDKKSTDPSFRQPTLTYALALGVYCTSWTFFGAVGTAAGGGWQFLPIYLGPALVFLFLPGLIRRIGNVAQRENVSSLSDFLSARYGKSQGVAVVATLAAVTGSLPYIALQLQSVGMSFQALTGTTTTVAAETPHETVLITALVLAAFAILFGARNSDTTKYNAGLMQVLAVEAVLKLAALMAVCALSIAMLNGSPEPPRLTVQETFGSETVSGRFITITLLSMAAIICLPRQFHVAIVERREPNEVRTARWAFPLYLALTSAVVVPITMAGLNLLPTGSAPDLFVLSLPLQQGDGMLAMLVFLGGFSAAMGMVVVSTIALSTMVTNDLIVPALMRSGRFDAISGQSGARLLLVRRSVIVFLLLLAFGFYRMPGGSNALAQIGLLSFAAAIQFAPALVGAVTWSKGQRQGVIAGLVLGIMIWAYTLLLPAALGIEAMRAHLPGWADPHGLFGVTFGDPLTHGVFVSLSANCAAFIFLSLRVQGGLRDRVQAAAFVGQHRVAQNFQFGGTDAHTDTSPEGLKALASRFLNRNAVEHAFEAFGLETGTPVSGKQPADELLIQHTEKLLAKALGASSARVVISSAIGGPNVTLPEVLSILDHKTRSERFERHMLQSMLENIDHGISVVDQEQKLVAWNSAYVELFQYPAELVVVGASVTDLIKYNLQQGWIEGDPKEQSERRIAHMQVGKRHMLERQIPDGRHLRIIGNPMPGGGYVTSFIDITQDKLKEQALIEANERLEDRVAERTMALSEMANDLDQARQDAEGANASKTRFLAAASHDLLQPLNAARLLLGAIESDPNMAPDKRVGLLDKADRSIKSADDLLKGLLDISRLDHGTITAKPTAVPLGPLFEDLVDEALPMAEEAGLRLKVVPTRLSVNADPGFLESILRNFLSNARRYTRDGGVLIGARRRGDQVRIEVWDTGPGIAEHQQLELFEEFRRFEDTDNAGLRGAGLGLSIAKRLAELMGSEIGVRSTLGQGSVFFVSCPIAGNPRITQTPRERNLSKSSEALSGLSVLCVDDEPAILDATRLLLQTWGCEVRLALTPSEAEAIAMQVPIDVIMADLNLRADRDGIELVSALVSELSAPENVAIITANNTQSVVDRCAQLGLHLLKKPSAPKEVRAFLELCASRLKAQAAE